MINLKEVITKYPECLGSAAKFRSYMLDLYPDPADQARIKVLADVLSCGVVDEIKKGKSDPIALSRYRKIVEEKYGYSPRLIEESIIRWTNAFEIKPAEQSAKKAPAKPAELDIGETIHVHKFKDTVVKPTCRDRGYTLHQCACGYEHKDSFTPVGEHSFEQVDEIKPTCFEEGRQDFLCSVCAEYKSESIPKVPHEFGAWKVAKEPRCLLTGIRERRCKNCAASEQEIIPLLGHKWSEWSTQSFATCTEDGKSVRQCENCKEVEEKVLPAIGHDFSEWVPSQSQEGMHERYCKNCGELQYRSSEDWRNEWLINKRINEIKKECEEIKKEKGSIEGMNQQIKELNGFIANENMGLFVGISLAIVGIAFLCSGMFLLGIVPIICAVPVFFTRNESEVERLTEKRDSIKYYKARLEMLEKVKAELEKQIANHQNDIR